MCSSSNRVRAFFSCQKKCSRSNSRFKRTLVIFASSYFLIGGSVFSATGSQTIQKCLHSDCHPSGSTITSKIFPFLKWFQTLPIITSVVIPFDKMMRHFRQRMGRAWLRRSRNWSCKNNHKKYNLSTRNKLCVGGCSKSHTKIQKIIHCKGMAQNQEPPFFSHLYIVLWGLCRIIGILLVLFSGKFEVCAFLTH